MVHCVYIAMLFPVSMLNDAVHSSKPHPLEMTKARKIKPHG